MAKVKDYVLVYALSKSPISEIYYTSKVFSNITYATKRIERAYLADGSEKLKILAKEINIVQKLEHKSIVKIADILKTRRHIYIIMEYCNGGTLKENYEKYIIKHGNPFSEKIIQHIMKQLVESVNYIYSKNIIHHDLRLENILLNYNTKEDKDNFNILNSEIKIIGFDQAMEKNSFKEETQKNFNEIIDNISLIQIYYYLLTGIMPFEIVNLSNLLNETEKGKILIPSKISVEAITFLLKMILNFIEQNPYLTELLTHPFLQKYAGEFSNLDLKSVSDFVEDGNIYVNVKDKDKINSLINKCKKE